MQIKATMSYPHLPSVKIMLIKKAETTDAVKSVVGREPLYVVGGNVNWPNQCGKQCKVSSKN